MREAAPVRVTPVGRLLVQAADSPVRSEVQPCLLQALALAHEHLDLPQLRDHLLGAKPLPCHRQTPFSKLNTTFNLAQKEPVRSERIKRNYRTDAHKGLVVDPVDGAGKVKAYPFRVGQPEDIAAIALFLASDESRMITGASTPTDGGWSAY